MRIMYIQLILQKWLFVCKKKKIATMSIFILTINIFLNNKWTYINKIYHIYNYKCIIKKHIEGKNYHCGLTEGNVMWKFLYNYYQIVALVYNSMVVRSCTILWNFMGSDICSYLSA